MDLLIVGAGPHALALLARVLEEEPGDLFATGHQTGFDQASRQHNLKRFGSRESTHQRLQRMLSRIAVIDLSGSWLANWNGSFEQFAIEHLRSPATIHPDPVDDMSLREFAETRQKQHMRKSGINQTASTATLNSKTTSFSELIEIDLLDSKHGKGKFTGTAGFNEGDREQLLLPKSKLFEDFNRALVQRYEIEHKVTRGYVDAIDPCCTPSTGGDTDVSAVKYFDVRWHKSGGALQHLRAKSVVLAIGSSNMANVPKWVAPPNGTMGAYPSEALLHSHQLAQFGRKLNALTDKGTTTTGMTEDTPTEDGMACDR